VLARQLRCPCGWRLPGAAESDAVVQFRRWIRPLLVLLLVILFFLVDAARADEAAYDPRSRIERPPGKGPTYLTAAAATGQLVDGDQARPGYSFSIVFRPHRAADFMNALYAWNTGLVLQGDWQGGGPAAIGSLDLAMRRYLADMRPMAGGQSVFLGLGVGISHAEWSRQPDSPDGSSDGFSFLTELGYEWNLDPTLVLIGKGQYRLYNRGGHNHSGWSLHLGIGFPFPF
jgi:hypothetical protein